MRLADLRPLTVGTAGHIDHGKTALIEALTGTNTDRLAEERRRGISIQLGFAELVLDDGRSLSIVDVPGHERFVRTMVAGASGIDLYLLVVAADDGVMPQTREHIAVLRALGIDRGVVALTKADIVSDERVREVVDEVEALLPAAQRAITSVTEGRGLDELRSALTAVARTVADGTSSPGWNGPATLHVDRAFSLKGVGTVVTGTLRKGAIARGDRIVLLPEQKEARVRSLHVHNRSVELAEPRQRVALNLAGVRRSAVARGDVVVDPADADAAPTPSYRADVELVLEPGSERIDGERVQLHHGTRESPCRVVYFDEAGRFAQLRLQSPIIAAPGDRVVLRSIAPPDTLGGAAVVDPNPRRHGPGRRAQELGLVVDGAPTELIESCLDAGQRVPADPDRWLGAPLLGVARHRHPRPDWLDAISVLVTGGGVIEHDGRLERPGSEHADSEPAPSAAELTDADRDVLGILDADGARPRSLHDVAETLGHSASDVRASVRRLRDAGLAVPVSRDVVYPAGEYGRLRRLLLGQLRESGGSISLAEARDELASSRKYAQAWLEHLDGSGVTVRRGDRHHLRSHMGRQGSGGPAGLQSQ